MSNLVTFEQGMQLKRLGFREQVTAYYIYGSLYYNSPINWNTNEGLDENGEYQEEDEYCSAPPVSSALDWIREEYSDKIVFEISVTTYHNLVRYMYRVREYTLNLGTYEQITHGIDYPTHPLAESALLTAVLNYLIEKK